MEKLLTDLVGKKLDINCGPGAVFSGVLNRVSEGVITLATEDDETVQIAIDKIIAIVETNDHPSRPGFIA